MSQPGLLILLDEVEVLQWVQLACASCHYVTVSGDHIGHVEVVDVFNEVGSVQIEVAIWFVGDLFEARCFDMIEFDNMWCNFCDSCSQFLDSVIWQWRANFFGKSSEDHPVVLGEAWR